MTIGIVSCKTLPEPDHDEAILNEALASRGVQTVMVPWDSPQAEIDGVDMLLLRSCWNYHLDLAGFLDWVEKAALQAPIENDFETVKWNCDKQYLRDLEGEGVPVVPTVWFDPQKNEELERSIEALHCERFVIKPSVSAGSYMTRLFDAHELEAAQKFVLDVAKQGAVMIQPYLKSVEEAGERSVVCIDGEARHVVVKNRRLAGDDESVSAGVEPTDLEKQLVEAVLQRFGNTPLYARLDLMLSDEDEWCVSELELIEPSLFLLQAPQTLPVFADSIVKRAEEHKDGTYSCS